MELDIKKSKSACSALTGVRRSGEAACFQPHSQSGLHPEELGTCNWTSGWLMTQRAGRWSLDKERKAQVAV